MAKHISILVLLCQLAFCHSVFTQPVIKIIATVKNCSDQFLLLEWEDPVQGLYISDTLKKVSHTSYLLTSTKLQSPQKARLWSEHMDAVDLYIAPGFDMHMEADAKNKRSLFQSISATGKGALINSLAFKLQTIMAGAPIANDSLSLNNRIFEIKRHHEAVDSLIQEFKRENKSEEAHLNTFTEMMRVDNLFEKIGMIFSLERSEQLNSDQIEKLLYANIDSTVVQNLFDRKYFTSSTYRELLTTDLLYHLAKKPRPANGDRIKLFDVWLQAIEKNYQDPLKDYALYMLLNRHINGSKSILELNDYYTLFKPFLLRMSNAQYKGKLYEFHRSKLSVLVSLQNGQLAPPFSLKDPAGKVHRLQDYKGRLIYLDLWASWCMPCRLETPYLKSLFNRYRKRTDIIFISIAVSDNVADWKKALKQDKPTWLQLFDKNTVVANAYDAHSIPKFVIIDKAGKILDFNAPAPSDQQRIVAILEEELKK
jgi:thiol-disulfide isomerase/thioredoxin